MSNCSNHRKDLMGQTDMQHVAEDIANLHYETLFILLNRLSKKLAYDAKTDGYAGRTKIAYSLSKASTFIRRAAIHINEAWQISKPFMEGKDETKKQTP